MSVAPFSIMLVIGILSCILFSSDLKDSLQKLFVLGIFVNLNIRMGYFLKLGDKEISIMSIVLLAMTGVSVVVAITRKMSASYLKWIWCFFTVLLISCGLLILFTYQKELITASTSWDYYIKEMAQKSFLDPNSVRYKGYLLMLVEYTIILWAGKTVFSRKNWEDIFARVLALSKISLIVGILEFICKNVFHSLALTRFFIFLFGNSSATHDYLDYSGGGLIALQGMTKEKAMFAFVLFLIAVMLLVENFRLRSTEDENARKINRNFLWLMLTLLLLGINMALSSCIYLGILLLLALILSKKQELNPRIRWIFLGTAVLGILAIGTIYTSGIVEGMMGSANRFLQRLGNAFYTLKMLGSGSALSVSSEVIRFRSIYDTILIILDRPLFGIGLGATYCTSGLFTMMSGIGIGGVGFWLLMLSKGFLKLDMNSKHFIWIVLLVMVAPNLLTNEFTAMLMLGSPVILLNLKYVYMDLECLEPACQYEVRGKNCYDG